VDITPGQLEALHQTFSRLELSWVPSLSDDEIFYGYSLLPCEILFSAINTAETVARGKRFLDVGCGIGTVLAMMHVMGYEVRGIDRVQQYIDVAQRIVPEATLATVDLFDTTDFDADVILLCHPCRTETKEREAEAHIVANAAPGTVLITPGANKPIGVRYVDGVVGVIE
jgi:2-polyprenyl-3-methyl-5-hydroxy-6-metoxy-1,4-benzoquinol methylase